MYDVAVLNVTGYAGIVTALLLQQHPEFRLVAASGRAEAGKSLSQVFPFWPGDDLAITESVPAVALVICALPHGAAAGAIAPLRQEGSRVVDISADFRLHDLERYNRWYGTHAAPELLREAVYGLPELHRDSIASSSLVANPGCYPTAAILALAPALRAGIIEHSVVVDAKSGISGGGRSSALTNQYSEVNEAVAPYGVLGHRHLPEIEQELSEVAGTAVRVIFTPHLVPMTRGLMASCYAPLREHVSTEAVQQLYRECYRDHPFVRVLTTPPSTKWTSGTNNCLITPVVDPSGSTLMVFSAIDNLVKGAAGQAIQNANLIVGLPEDVGLHTAPAFP